MGVNALFSNTAGGNTGIGANALRANTTGFQNTAVVTARSLTIPAALSTRLSVQAHLL